VGGGFNLTVNTGRTTTFAGSSSVATVTTDAAGTTAVNGNVTTTGNQTYNDPVTVAAGVIAGGSAVTFNGTVDSATQAVANPGFETGNLSPWATTGPTLAAPSTAQAHSGLFSVLVGNPLNLTQNATYTLIQTVTVPTGTSTLSAWYYPASRDNVLFDQLTIQVRNAAGTTVLATLFNDVSDSQAWTQVTRDMTPFAGQTVQLYFAVHDDGVTPYSTMYVDDVTLIGSLPARSLTVNTSGSSATTFAKTIGGTNPLASLTTNAGGTTKLGGTVTTTGAQTYNDPVTLTADVTLASTGGGAITLRHSQRRLQPGRQHQRGHDLRRGGGWLARPDERHHRRARHDGWAAARP
jgi:hypothetical protein